ncbi:MAG: Tm-1-like ATP-binding domain-containing protein [Bacteroidota bacterium]
MKTILLIGTFDTKGEEFAYVRDIIRSRGHEVLLMDAGVLGDPAIPVDVSASEAAVAGGSTLAALRAAGDRGTALDVMIAGVSRLTAAMHNAGKFDGVLSLGGGGGTNLGTAAMQQLPVGIPKLMVSTLASSDVHPYVGVKDITMMYSVVDIAGLNRISRQILANAAGAICGMVEQAVASSTDRPLIATTMFGVTTPCVTRVREQLEAAGYEVLVFHATGAGGRAMEGLISDGYISAVADVTTTEWCDELAGGVLSAGPDRLDAAAAKGVPQVVSVGALDMVNFHAMHTVPETFADRTFYKHNPNVTLMRTSAHECAQLGKIIAEKLNAAQGPTVLMLPLKGVSMIDAEGQPFFDSTADKALFEAIRTHAGPAVELVELDLHINDPAFADAIATKLLSLIA